MGEIDRGSTCFTDREIDVRVACRSSSGASVGALLKAALAPPPPPPPLDAPPACRDGTSAGIHKAWGMLVCMC
jgi:hypothetical protein